MVFNSIRHILIELKLKIIEKYINKRTVQKIKFPFRISSSKDDKIRKKLNGKLHLLCSDKIKPLDVCLFVSKITCSGEKLLGRNNKDVHLEVS